jgi:hypothetical protein
MREVKDEHKGNCTDAIAFQDALDVQGEGMPRFLHVRQGMMSSLRF